MADHYHYASDLYQVAEEHHRHYDHEQNERDLRQSIDGLRYRVSDLEEALREATVEIARMRAALPDPYSAERAEAANRAAEEWGEDELVERHRALDTP